MLHRAPIKDASNKKQNTRNPAKHATHLISVMKVASHIQKETHALGSTTGGGGK
jgi:hypothetical protein